MKVLLLGATGYVGRNVAAELINAGYQTTALVRDPSRAARLPAGIGIATGDLAQPDTFASSIHAHDVVINAAFPSHDGSWFDAVEVEHSFHKALVEQMADTGKTLILSNGTAFLGDSGSGQLDEAVPVQEEHPAAVRAFSVKAGLDGHHRGIRTIELRLASFVYGQGGSVFLPQLIDAARSSGRSIYVGDGQYWTSTVHVATAARAFVAAIEHGRSGEVYHIAGDEEPAIRSIAEAVAIGVGCEVASVTPEEAARSLNPFTAMFLQLNNRLDSSKARRELHWSGAIETSLLWDVAHGSYVTTSST
ncbi:MAG: NAD-dependent epimerase/dehydratase family protein [Chloroflexota bacterium]